MLVWDLITDRAKKNLDAYQMKKYHRHLKVPVRPPVPEAEPVDKLMREPAETAYQNVK